MRPRHAASGRPDHEHRRLLNPANAWVLLVLFGCRADASTASPPEPVAAVEEAAPEQGGTDAGAELVLETPNEVETEDSAALDMTDPPEPGAEPDELDEPGEHQVVHTGAAAPAETKAPAEKGKKEDQNALPKPIYRKVDASCGKDTAAGTKLQPFKLKTVDGKDVGNRSWGRRILLVNFWGTWCKPCLKELPEFDRLYRRYRKHGLTLVAIATDDDPEPVKAFADKRRLAAKMVVGGEEYAGKYGAAQFPFTFVVDPDGTIISSYVGYKPQCMGKLEADIRARIEHHR